VVFKTVSCFFVLNKRLSRKLLGGIRGHLQTSEKNVLGQQRVQYLQPPLTNSSEDNGSF
jgi:hypothetical protein